MQFIRLLTGFKGRMLGARTMVSYLSPVSYEIDLLVQEKSFYSRFQLNVLINAATWGTGLMKLKLF